MGGRGLRGLWARIRSYVRGVGRRRDVEAEIAEEFEHHIELRTRDLMREGLSRPEAGRRARLEFGHVESHREAARAARGLRLFDQLRFSWLDVKLGLRMLGKHPGLTVVAIFALAVGIPVGLAPTFAARALEAPLPEDTSDRIRAVRLWDPTTTFVVVPTGEDLEHWRDALVSFERLGGYRTSAYNLSSEDGRAAAVAGAEVSPEVFGILATPPLLGRTLDQADAAVGAERVVVLGHDVWLARFGAADDIVGRTVEVAGESHTVVGVMPRDFYFPMRQQLWLPLVEAEAAAERVRVVGRLVDGIDVEEAQAELAAVPIRADPAEATVAEGSRQRLFAEIVPFPIAYANMPRDGFDSMVEFHVLRIVALVLLLIACGNVAMLLFARTATRLRELAVRTALGASRTRVISQLFVEALVLAVGAAGLGLGLGHVILGQAADFLIARGLLLPYWLQTGVDGRTVVYALGLAVLSATVAGVLPAIRVTGSKVSESIRRAQPGASGIRFGGVTGSLIVLDVAVSIIALGFALSLGHRLTDTSKMEELVGIPSAQFLTFDVRLPIGELAWEGEVRTGRSARLARTQLDLVERLRAEPGVRSVAVGETMPRMDHRSRRFEVEDAPDTRGGRWMRSAVVDVEYFEGLGAPILAGRGFTRADVDEGAAPVIVNTVFVDRYLGGADPIGRRVRTVLPPPDSDPWHEIVGVVGHLGMNIVNAQGDAGIYLPAAPGGIYPVRIGVHLGDDPEAFVPTVRRLAEEVDPAAIVGTPAVLGDVYQGDWYMMIGVFGGFGLLIAILVALASSGLYAIMSYAVSERTREIGVRTALGAGRGVLVYAIVRRSLLQVGLGALLGLPLSARVFFEMREQSGRLTSPFGATMTALGLSLAIVTLIALCSCVVPTRRALAIEPTDALRADG